MLIDERGGNAGCFSIFLVFNYFFFLDLVVDVIVLVLGVVVDVGGVRKGCGGGRVNVMFRRGVSVDRGRLDGLRDIQGGGIGG